MAEKKEKSVTQQIIVAVVVALIAGGSVPWWWNKVFPANNTDLVAEASQPPETTDGWAIIGYVQNMNYSGMKLSVQSDTPAIGKRYKATDRFRLIQKRPQNSVDQGQVVTLGMVRRGDTVEILNLYIETPSSKRVPVWAKLRAVVRTVGGG